LAAPLGSFVYLDWAALRCLVMCTMHPSDYWPRRQSRATRVYPFGDWAPNTVLSHHRSVWWQLCMLRALLPPKL
jgi:hypothetical protein